MLFFFFIRPDACLLLSNSPTLVLKALKFGGDKDCGSAQGCAGPGSYARLVLLAGVKPQPGAARPCAKIKTRIKKN